MKKNLILASLSVLVAFTCINSVNAETTTTNNTTTGVKWERPTNASINNQNRPEPPKDKDGNPLPPPNFKKGSSENGNFTPPEPPKDKDGNPLPPPNMNTNDGIKLQLPQIQNGYWKNFDTQSSTNSST